MNRLTRVWAVAVVGVVLALQPVAATGEVCDDFEDAPTNAFPEADWADVTTYGFAEPGGPDPSALVVASTDAQGDSTNVVTIVEQKHDSRGIYQAIPVADQYVISADIRIDQFSDPGSLYINDWAMGIGVAMLAVEDFARLPQVQIYATAASNSQEFRLFVCDLSVWNYEDILLYDEVETGTWYTVIMDLDAVNGQVRSRILDAETCEVLVDQVDDIDDWSTYYADDYDVVAAFGGETEVPPQANIASIDNIVVDSACNDCNSNGIPDQCDPDCNTNGIPDECDIAAGTSEDCNTNAIPDSCDIAAGTSEDLLGDGIPDECQLLIVGDWKSLKNHGTALYPNWLYIPIWQNGKPAGQASDGSFRGMETRVNGITTLECTFNKAINLPSTSDIVMCGCSTNGGPYNPDSVSLDGTSTVLTMAWSGIPNGQIVGGPDAYIVTLNDVTDLEDNPLAGDNDIEIWAQFGNVDIKPVNPHRGNVDNYDLSELGTYFTQGPMTNQFCMMDVWFASGSKNKVDNWDDTNIGTYFSTMPCTAAPTTCP